MEAALTLPLAVFMVLGTLQLFLMLQARLLTEHAAFNATRAGSLSQGSCKRMLDAALVSVLPAIARTDSPEKLRDAYVRYRDNRFDPATDDRRSGPVIWIFRKLGIRNAIAGGRDDAQFDDPDRPHQLDRTRLETTVVFWYPMRIPFANWVMARSTLAAWGLGNYAAQNPLMPAQNAQWTRERTPTEVQAGVLGEFKARTMAGEYVFPIQATAAMRMMTPAMKRAGFFDQPNCGGP